MSEKTRGIFRWYVRGGLTANEAVGLIGLACLGWYERARTKAGVERLSSGLVRKGAMR
ncbi:MAG: hypothetical protein GX493_05860 [Firmicutes bacterium]|nr:hypothetical protein [Bacillota bacterium]